jgi:hypothetical protein
MYYETIVFYKWGIKFWSQILLIKVTQKLGAMETIIVIKKCKYSIHTNLNELKQQIGCVVSILKV